MKTFANLINALDSTNKTSGKIAAIERFLKHAENQDKISFLALFTGRRPKRIVPTAQLKKWAMQQSEIPAWLFLECYAAVGDLGETISLILPEPKRYREQTLSEWIAQIDLLKTKSEAEKQAFIIESWSNLPHTQRFIFNKLLGGNFRIGISSKSLINAIATHYALEPSAVAHALMGDWQKEGIVFEKLVRGEYADIQLSKPYPFCLAHPLRDDIENLGDRSLWQIEYKWDGIRGQLIKRQNEVFIWSRGEELITAQFSELRDALQKLSGDFVIDGEILIYKGGRVANFAELQKRLNRKTISRAMLNELPAAVFAYDLLEWNGVDIRDEPLWKRRKSLESLLENPTDTAIMLSPVISAQRWSTIRALHENALKINSEGLMLKQRYSPYHAGRKRGDWWKWKIAPRTIDAVLVYAQKGSGRRSGYYTDYTFAVKNGKELVTIAKAYSGLTNEEIQQVSRFVNKNAIERFGPVRTVKPELVFEIAFEGISFSKRHKSGVALRFPRILRWRKDKTADQIDELDDIKNMIS